jgi:hypothetical protein
MSLRQSNLQTLPVVVLPKESYHSQSMMAMCVASQYMGGISHEGPSDMFPTHWKHIAVFYIFELLMESYTIPGAIPNSPPSLYTILWFDLPTFDSLLYSFLFKHGSSQVKRISVHENFQDNFLVVINNFDSFPVIRFFLAKIDDSCLLQAMASQAQVDISRGNCKD